MHKDSGIVRHMLSMLKNYLNGSRDGQLWGVLRWCYIRLFSRHKTFNRGACYLSHAGAFCNKISSANIEMKADVYIAGEPESLLAAVRYKKKYGGKVVWFIREHPFRLHRLQPLIPYSKQELEKFHKLDQLVKACMPEVDLCICTGEGFAQFCREQHMNALSMNFRLNFVKRDFVRIDFRSQLHLSKDTKLIAYPCSIYTATNIKSMLNTLAGLPKHFHFVHVGLFRPVSLKKQFLKLAANLGVLSRVHLLSALPRSKMLACLSDCDVGLVDLDPKVGGCYLGVHNRFVDLMSAGVPFVYSPNVSMRHLHPEQSWAVESAWGEADELRQKLLVLSGKKELLEPEIKAAVDDIIDRGSDKCWLDLEVFFAGVSSAVFVDTIVLPGNKPSMQLAKWILAAGCSVRMIYKRLGWWTQLQIKSLSSDDF